MSRRDGIVKNGLGLPRAVHSLEQNVSCHKTKRQGRHESGSPDENGIRLQSEFG